MGFRSQIHIKCKVSKAFEFKHFLSTYKTDHGNDLVVEENFYTDKEHLYLTLNDWKFYEGYPVVDDIIAFVGSHSMEDHIGMIAIHEDETTSEWGAPWEVGLYASMIIEGM